MHLSVVQPRSKPADPAAALVQMLWPRLSEPEQEDVLIKAARDHIQTLEQQLSRNRAALIHLEAQVIDVACDDPGRLVGNLVLLPMLRERLESQAQEYYNQDVLQEQQQVCLHLKLIV